MKIYFAGSIRGGRDDQELYAEIIKLLSNYGEVLTEHLGDQKISQIGESGKNINIYDRDISDIVVAEVSTPSLGVGYEIAKAENLNKKVICIYQPSDNKRLSAMIGGNPHVINKDYQNLEDLEKIFNELLK
jgi:2'-deoxynucleoside 5'-phosphate N-hydrolase